MKKLIMSFIIFMVSTNLFAGEKIPFSKIINNCNSDDYICMNINTVKKKASEQANKLPVDFKNLAIVANVLFVDKSFTVKGNFNSGDSITLSKDKIVYRYDIEF